MQEELVQYSRSKGVALTAYSPLGSSDSPLLSNPLVTKVAEKYGVSPANVLISLQANRPDVAGASPMYLSSPMRVLIASTVLTKSVTPERVIQNFKIIDLTDDEIAELNDLEKTAPFRACYPWWAGWGDLGFPDCRAMGPPRSL